MTKGQLIGAYNFNEGTIRYKRDLIFLTDIDNKVLKVLLNNYNKVVKTETLCKRVYGQELDDQYCMAIRVAISRLRNKIYDFAEIQCKRSFGYRLIMKGKKQWQK